MTCRAAYLSVFRSSLVNMTTKDQLCTGEHNLTQRLLHVDHNTKAEYY